MEPEQLKEFPRPPVCVFSDDGKVPCIISWLIWVLGIVVVLINLYWMRRTNLRKDEHKRAEPSVMEQ
jgi:hypothetical protein